MTHSGPIPTQQFPTDPAHAANHRERSGSTADGFDPYHAWLGIPKSEQPATYYRLLGINLYENDSDVIAHAADRQMLFLRQFQLGPHQSESQQLLNEVATAKVCLLNAASKASYDQRLKEAAVAKSVSPPPIPDNSQNIVTMQPAINANKATSASICDISSATQSLSRKFKPTKRDRQQTIIYFAGHVVASIAGIAIAWVLIRSIWLRDSDAMQDKPSVSEIVSSPNRPDGPTPSPNGRQKFVPSPRKPRFNIPAPIQPPVANSNSSAKNAGNPSASNEEQKFSLETWQIRREAALLVYDLRTLLHATEQIARHNGDDILASKIDALASIHEQSLDEDVTRSLAEKSMELMREAIKAGRKDIALQAAEMALANARKINAPDLMRQATVGLLEIQKLSDSNQDLNANSPSSVERVARSLPSANLGGATENPQYTPGLVAELFNDTKFERRIESRIDSTIDLNWGSGRPDPDINTDNFGIRWRGYIKPPKAGRYTIAIKSDNGVRLTFNGAVLIDKLSIHGQHELTATVDLEDGYHPIQLEFLEGILTAWCHLRWRQHDGFHEQVIGAEYLFHDSQQRQLAGLEMAVKPIETNRGDIERPVVYLSDLDETIVRIQNGWFFKHGRMMRNEEMFVNGEKSKYGIFTHPSPNGSARISYSLEGKYKRFYTEVIIPQSTRHNQGEPATPLTFAVVGDGKELWRSKPLAQKGQTEVCDIDITGVRTLEIQVHCPGRDNWAYAAWVDPYVTE